MKNLFINILKNSKSWNDFKSSIPQDIIVSGKLFELFTKYYFIVEPKVQDDYKNVWLYNEIPASVKEKLNIGNVEHGVDLILEDSFGNYSAVQCKFRSDEATRLSWTKDKIANLFGFIPNASNYIVFTNASEIDEVSKTRAENFIFFNIHDLLDMKEYTFQSMLSFLESNLITPVKKYTPKSHQKDAIDKTVEHFKQNSRGQLILPCGAGKTLTALWIKESLKPRNTLVLVPSLALLKQIKNDWAEQKNDPYLYVCVCSDKDIDSNEKDALVMHTFEIDSKVLSKPEKIYEFLTTNNDTEKVIFSTYQSLDKIIEAIRNHDFNFDLVICDEAHRTAGAKTGLFSLIHDNKNIPADKRLYMTATPRVTSTTLKNKIGADVDLLYDMSNPVVYGNEIYRMSFKDAIEKGILIDHKIIAIGITDQEIQKHIEERRYVSEFESIDEIANNFALEIVMNKYQAYHTISFQSRVKLAEQFCQRHKDFFDYYVGHVNGSQPTSLRSRILNDFKNSNKGIVSNARCLTEGVDIPAIDMVYFCDPKNSKIDIVQAAGRALRTDHSRNKTIGYIVVPLFHNDKEGVESAINTCSFRNVIQVIRSLSDHDDRLQDEINQIAYGKGKKKFSKIEVTINDEDSEVITLLNFKEKLKKSLFDQIIEKSSNNWDLMYLEFVNWLSETEEYPTKQENVHLYTWITSQRNRKRNNLISNSQIKKLEQLNFIWNAHDSAWDKNYQFLIQFRTENPDRWPKQRDTTGIEQQLAIWMMKQRADYRKIQITNNKLELLKKINFPFEPEVDRWRKTYNDLCDWLKHRGGYPRGSTDNKKEINLYLWCCKQRTAYNENSLDEEQKILLDKIYFKEFLDLAVTPISWEERFNQIKEFHQEFSKFPTYSKKNDDKINTLASWCNKQRQQFKENLLSQSEIDQLNSLVFVFDTEAKNREAWDTKFQNLVKFRSENPDRWPSHSSLGSKELKLAQWLNNNRQWHNGLLKKYGKYPEDRKQKLESIGFNWISDIGVFGHVDNWDEKFEQLRIQIEQKNFKYRDISGNGNTIYNWLMNQKRKFKNGKLESEKVIKLKTLGIDLNGKATEGSNDLVWDEKYETLKKQIESGEFRTIDDKRKKTPIFGWLTRQRMKYRVNKLDKQKIEKLLALGINLDSNILSNRLSKVSNES